MLEILFWDLLRQLYHRFILRTLKNDKRQKKPKSKWKREFRLSSTRLAGSIMINHEDTRDLNESQRCSIGNEFTELGMRTVVWYFFETTCNVSAFINYTSIRPWTRKNRFYFTLFNRFTYKMILDLKKSLSYFYNPATVGIHRLFHIYWAQRNYFSLSERMQQTHQPRKVSIPVWRAVNEISFLLFTRTTCICFMAEWN